jgi:hypothetical protein
VERPTITLQLNEDDYLDGALFAARWTKKRWLIMGTMAAVYLGAGLYMVRYAPRDFFILGWALIGAVAGGFISGLLSRYVLLPRRLKSRFAEHKTLHRKSTMAWDENGLTVEGENSHTLIPWPDFFKFRESDTTVFLYTSRALFLMVPKRFFVDSAQLNEFVVLARSRIAAQ